MMELERKSEFWIDWLWGVWERIIAMMRIWKFLLHHYPVIGFGWSGGGWRMEDGGPSVGRIPREPG